ncbi:uncharacterized protein [Miscanthus floridulus]|uniref:uncharacterized protein n=1 Tax=Miscanthus floridulus TaxID=154761 RepID=UPI0034596D53
MDPNRSEWIAPYNELELRPRDAYVVSFVSFHEHGLGVLTDRFMRALPHYYGVELHNFNPNSIAQVAIFVVVYKGYLGIAPHWELWLHLFRGMRDVRSSPPPILEDVRRWMINRVHADMQKKWKDAKAMNRTKKILTREELDKRRRQQRKDGLPLEESLSSSLSMEASDGDDEGEVGQGPLDHLPNIVEVVPGALASSPALPGGGRADSGSAIARSGAKTDTPEARALGKCVVSPVGSAAAMEQVAVEATQLPPQRTEGVSGSIEDQLVPMDTEAMPLPPPPPLGTRVTVVKWLPPCSSRKRPAEVPTLVPLKALKVSPGSIAHWVASVQATLHHGVASARADPKEPASLGGATEAALTQEGEVAPPPHDGEACGSDVAKVPLAAETSGTEVPRVSQAGATETAAPGTIEAAAVGTRALATAEVTMAETGAPRTTEATMVEAEAPRITDANVIMAGLPA